MPPLAPITRAVFEVFMTVSSVGMDPVWSRARSKKIA
jgi:hypothetical protein